MIFLQNSEISWLGKLIFDLFTLVTLSCTRAVEFCFYPADWECKNQLNGFDMIKAKDLKACLLIVTM